VLDFRSSTVSTPALVLVGEVENISKTFHCHFSTLVEDGCDVVILVKCSDRAKTRVFQGAESTHLSILVIGSLYAVLTRKARQRDHRAHMQEPIQRMKRLDA